LREAPAPRSASAGDRIVKVLASDASARDAGDKAAENRIYTALVSAITAAQRSVHLTMAYFAPGQEVIDALTAAARRGVQVVLVLPGTSDFALVLHAGRSYYDELLEAGVTIHEMQHAVMHAKAAVIDGVFSTIGSSNMDWRSFAMNDELNAIVLGADFGREMEALFARDRAVSPRVEPATWAARPWRQRALEALGRAAERWL
jgi:cardiolipin synthase A/B